MIPFRLLLVTAALLAPWSAAASAQSAWVFKFANSSEAPPDLTCKVYALNDVDPALASWVAQTIPEMIEPGSWTTAGGRASLNFYPPKKLLVVRHTNAAHARIGEFLKEISRASAPATFATTPREPALLRTHHLMPAMKTDVVESKPQPPRRTDGNPRHLFHIIVDGFEGEGMKLKNFTLRYEGEGIIDSTIAELIKSMQGAGTFVERMTADPALPSGHYLPCPPTYPPSTCPADGPAAPTTAPGSCKGVTPPVEMPRNVAPLAAPLIRAISVTTPPGVPIGSAPVPAPPPPGRSTTPR